MNEPNVAAPPPAAPDDPYAPPAARWKESSARFPSPTLSALVGTQALAGIGFVAPFFGAPGVVISAAAVLLIPVTALQLWWFRNQWKRLPARLQMVKNQGVTPTQAAVRNLIPFYNFYWMFVVNAALCDGIDAIASKKGRRRTAPIWLATLCPLVTIALQFISRFTQGPALLAAIVLFVALWGAYAIRVEIAFDQAKRKRD